MVTTIDGSTTPVDSGRTGRVSVSKVIADANNRGRPGRIPSGVARHLARPTPTSLPFVLRCPAVTAGNVVRAGLVAALVLAAMVAAPGGAEGSPEVVAGPCAGARITIRGTNGPNRLVGTPRRDVIAGLGGNDTILGQGGNDTICGGGGNDTVRGGDGADRVEGGNGNDKAYGDAGNDQVLGGAGLDTVRGGDGTDTVNGGTGDDQGFGDAGVDQLLGEAGFDRLRDTSAGADTLTGGDGADICTPTVGDTVDCEYTTADPLVVSRFNQNPVPQGLDVESSSEITSMDLYAILDRSGSMTEEITDIRNNLASVVEELQ